MNDNVVEVKIRADASGMVAGTREAGSALGGLTDSLKEWRTHVRTEARYTNFMATQIAGLGIASKGAAAEITGLVSAFAFGGGLGVGIELIKMAAHAFHDVEESAAAAKEAMKKWGDELAAGTEKVKKWSETTLMALRGASQAQLKAHEDLKGLLEEREKKEKEIALLESNVASAREDEAANEFEAMQKAAPEDEKKLARLREELRLLNEAIPKRQVAIGAVATEQIGQDTEKKLEEDEKLYEQEEKLLQAHLMRVSKAEFDAMKALQKMRADQDKYDLDRVLEQEKKEDDAAAVRDKAVKERFHELKKIIHETMAEGNTFGTTLGTALSGIATSTLSVTKAFASMGQAIVRVIFDQVRKAIEAYALQAAAAAAAANAGMPVVGLFMAAAAAAAMEALVMGLLGSLPSAAVGMPYVPKDMPVMVHQGERILTAKENQDYGQGSGGGLSLTVNITALDTQGVREFVERPEFARAIREAQRNGRL